MLQQIIIMLFISLLFGCVTPVSSNCIQETPSKNPNTNSPTNTQNCSEVDAIIYLASALYKESEKSPQKEKIIEDPAKGITKCSGLIGKAQKECQRKAQASYDPLDEL
jgi:hypothetical protein